MNDIRKTVSKIESKLAYRRKSPATIANELLEHIRLCGIPDMTFLGTDTGIMLSKEDTRRLEAHVKHRFEIWANSWMAPGLNYIAKNISEE